MVALSGCGGGGESSPTAPTTPSQPVTETFSGTFGPAGTSTHSFRAQASGSLAVVVVALQPDTVVAMGLGLGTWNGTSCSLQITTADARQGNTFNLTVSTAPD